MVEKLLVQALSYKIVAECKRECTPLSVLAFCVMDTARLAHEVDAFLANPGLGLHAWLELWRVALAPVAFGGAGAEPGLHEVSNPF